MISYVAVYENLVVPAVPERGVIAVLWQIPFCRMPEAQDVQVYISEQAAQSGVHSIQMGSPPAPS